jgi:hypothetical protein
MRFKSLPVSVLAATLLVGGPGLALAQNTTPPATPPATTTPGPAAPAVTPGPVTNNTGGGGGGLWGLIGLVGLLGLGGWRSRSSALPPTTGVGTGVGTGTTNRL